ncbi:MAG: thioredoxin-dependent thiol peroxidase [Chloroflexota bacterium]|nr:thioredoxin-dependent thiol peroxidase [Chloroflexota bacterium]
MSDAVAVAAYPTVGERAPDFRVPADDGAEVSLDSLAGRRFVLYFYPEDDTPGCTTQACGLRDEFAGLRHLDIEVFGISPDSVASHARFRKKYALPFRLLADAGHRVADTFGVWVPKTSRGRTYMGIERTTFVIGPDGRVEHVFPRVRPAEHAGLLLAALG